MTTKRNVLRVMSKLGWAALPILTVITFVVVQVRRITPMIVINNMDYSPLLERALVLSFRSLEGWVHPIHPVGFSWLIRLGLELGWDAARVGQGLSVAGGVVGLIGTYLIALSMFRDKRWAGIVQAFVLCTSLFLYFGSVEGNDMPAAGLQIFSLGVLAVSGLGRAHLSLRLVFLAGFTAGLAYLMRYTGMITAGVGILWLIGIALLGRDRAAWKALGVYVAAFVLVTAVQWIPTLRVTGNPFAIDQGPNVWFHLYDKTDFIREFQQAPPGITVAQLFVQDPGRFVQQWWGAFQRFWVAPELTLLDAPLKLFAQAGLVFLLLAPGPVAPRLRGLLTLFVLAHLASLSMMRLDRRFLIVMIPLLATGAVYFLATLIPSRWECRRVALPLNVVVLLIGLVWASQVPIGFVQGRPSPDQAVLLASNVLHAAGMSSANEVLNTRQGLHDVADRERKPFRPAFWVAPDLKSVDDLVQAMRSRGWRFFVYDQATGVQVYPELQSLLAPETRPTGLVPIYVSENSKLAIYRLADTRDCPPIDAHFENGIALECYESHVSRDVPAGSGRRVGVYLNWRAGARLDVSLKVFVHVLNAEGRLVAQDDSIPALWTYPTSEWKSGEVIIDFHQFELDASLPPGDYVLRAGLYDPDSGARVAVGANDHVVLKTITIR